MVAQQVMIGEIVWRLDIAQIGLTSERPTEDSLQKLNGQKLG